MRVTSARSWSVILGSSALCGVLLAPDGMIERDAEFAHLCVECAEDVDDGPVTVPDDVM